MGRLDAAFVAKLSVTANGCWIWTGCRVQNGYGQVRREGRNWLTHRWAYERLVAPIPEGLHIDHLCRNRACVNPAHLEPVTQRENTLRGINHVADRARQTSCVHGHPFDAVNTYVRPNGTRSCRTCARLHMRRRYLLHGAHA